MNLKETVAQMTQEELGECIEKIEFVGPYEGEEFNILITLRDEPEDFDKREGRLRVRVWELGYDIGIFVDYPPQTITV
jgi:hypothetical protein